MNETSASAFESKSQNPDSLIRLTRRELQVLRLIAAGTGSEETAEHLCISKRTVDYHLSNIFAKLGVNNRMRAVRAARKLALLPLELRGRRKSQ